MFSEFELQKQLKRYPETADCPLHFFDTVSSTNRAAKALARKELNHSGCRQRTDPGRGRKNRDFFLSQWRNLSERDFLSSSLCRGQHVSDDVRRSSGVRAVEEYCGVRRGSNGRMIWYIREKNFAEF